MPRLLPQERARLDRAVATLWRYRHRLSGGQEASVRALAESLATGPDHGQVLVVRPGWGPVSVDWGIAPLLRACWAVGAGTEFSCQEGLRGMAYIAFTSPADMARFRGLLDGLGDVGWWEWEDDDGMLPCVRFPAVRMEEVTGAVRAGSLERAGSPDRSTPYRFDRPVPASGEVVPRAPALDQGDVGASVGYAWYSTMGSGSGGGASSGDAARLYAEAQVLDEWPGEWPGEEGS